MTIEELDYSAPAGGGAPAFDRTPPQDLNAEQSVLGGMMISKDAIADVVEQVRGSDFYKPAHEAIYDAVLDLYGRGEPADAVTVADELTKRGDINRIGGVAYLHTLISMVPTAANAGYYARIVRERAVLRRLVEAGTRIVQIGYATDGGDVDELVNNAQAEVYAVSERRTTEDYHRLGEVIDGTLNEIEAAGNRGEGMIGVPTGFADLDRLTNGLHPGQMIVIAARPAIGKALALDTALPTPTGWTTMGDVQVGDRLIAADGTPTTVVATTEVLTDRPCYRVRFDDGTEIVADAWHEWFTRTRAERRRSGDPGQVRTTEQIARTLTCDTADRRANHAVAVAPPLRLPDADLPLHPYALGVRLGDGHSASARFTSADPEIAMRIEGLGYDLTEADRSVSDRLRALGVLDDEHIPSAYLRAGEGQRRDLLAGLLDAAGTVDPSGRVHLPLGNLRLAEDVQELVHSLGYRVTPTAPSASAPDLVVEDESARSVASPRLKPHFVHSRRNTLAGPAGRGISFESEDDVFALERKRLVHKDRRRPSTSRVRQRMVVAVEPIASVPVRCVQIDHPEHLYLAGRSFVPTHNSTLALDFARAASIKTHQASVVFSLEMSRSEITMRLLSAEARVPLQKLRTGQMGDDDWQKLAAIQGKLAEAPLFIDDSPNMSLMEIRAKCRRLKQKHDLKLVLIDYLQLMSSGKRVESRQQEVSEFSRALKLLAKELEVPVIALSQLNRGPEQRTDKKPQMSDLRESGSIEQDADMVILLHREDAYERESPRAGEADLIVAKHRNGPTDTITVAFQGHYSRFVDMQA